MATFNFEVFDHGFYSISEELPLPDAVPPVVTFITSNPVTKTTPIVVQVTDNLGELSIVDVSVSYLLGEIAYDVYNTLESYTTMYSSSSTSPIANGIQLSLLQNDNWYEAFRVHVTAVDSSGNTVSTSRAYGVTNGDGLPTCPELPPAGAGALANWQLVSPSELNLLTTREPIVLDVIFAEETLLALNINISFKSLGINDVIFADTRFSARYAALSSYEVLSDRRRYTLFPTAGWPRMLQSTQDDEVSLSVVACVAMPEVW